MITFWGQRERRVREEDREKNNRVCIIHEFWTQIQPCTLTDDALEQYAENKSVLSILSYF